MLVTGRGTNVQTKLHYNNQLKSNSLHGYIYYKCPQDVQTFNTNDWIKWKTSTPRGKLTEMVMSKESTLRGEEIYNKRPHSW